MSFAMNPPYHPNQCNVVCACPSTTKKRWTDQCDANLLAALLEKTEERRTPMSKEDVKMFKKCFAFTNQLTLKTLNNHFDASIWKFFNSMEYDLDCKIAVATVFGIKLQPDQLYQIRSASSTGFWPTYQSLMGAQMPAQLLPLAPYVDLAQVSMDRFDTPCSSVKTEPSPSPNVLIKPEQSRKRKAEQEEVAKAKKWRAEQLPTPPITGHQLAFALFQFFSDLNESNGEVERFRQKLQTAIQCHSVALGNMIIRNNELSPFLYSILTELEEKCTNENVKVDGNMIEIKDGVHFKVVLKKFKELVVRLRHQERLVVHIDELLRNGVTRNGVTLSANDLEVAPEELVVAFKEICEKIRIH